jgi:hypothetical protein
MVKDNLMLDKAPDYCAWNDEFLNSPACFIDMERRGFGRHLLPLAPHAGPFTAGTSLNEVNAGKIPGAYSFTTQAWCGMRQWQYNYDPVLREDVGTYDDGTSRPKPLPQETLIRDVWPKWPDCGVGLHLVELCAADIDVTHATMAEKIKALIIQELGPAPCRVGQAPNCLLLYRTSERIRKTVVKFTLEGEKHAVEFLGANQQIAVHAVHPKTGDVIRWTSDLHLLHMDKLTVVDVAKLSACIDKLEALIVAEGGTLIEKGTAGTAPEPGTNTKHTGFVETPQRIETAIKHLDVCVSNGRIAVRGSHADDLTRDIGYELCNELGLPPKTPQDLMIERWAPHCEPFVAPGSEEAKAGRMTTEALIRKCVRGQGQNAPPEPGKERLGSERFKDSPYLKAEQERAKQGKPKRFLARISDILGWPDPIFLVQDYFLMGAHFALIGEPKCGKTFIALDLSLSTAAGLPTWNGKKISRHGPVIYLSGEGHAGMKSRIKAWCKHHKMRFKEITDPDGAKRMAVLTVEGKELPFFYKTNVPEAQKADEHIKEYVDGVKAILTEESLGEPVLVVIDTMSRSMIGLDENSPAAGNLYLKLAEGLRAGLGLDCTCLSIAHSPRENKSGSIHVRGTSATDGGLDGAYSVEKNKANNVVKMSGGYFKDMEDPPPICFKISKEAEGTGMVLVMTSLAEYLKKNAAQINTERSQVVEALRALGAVDGAHGVETRRLAERIVFIAHDFAAWPPKSDKSAWAKLDGDIATWSLKLRNGKRIQRGKKGPLHDLYNPHYLDEDAEKTVDRWCIKPESPAGEDSPDGEVPF